MRFLELKKNIKKDYSGMKRFPVAVLGDSATQLIVQALRGYGYEVGLDLQIFEADYDQIERQIMDQSSEFYRSAAEYIVIIPSVQKLIKRFYSVDPSNRSVFAAEEVARIGRLVVELNARIPGCKLIVANFMETNDSVFGQYGNKINSSFLFQVRRLNCDLMTLCQQVKNLFLCDIAALSAYHGHVTCVDNRNYIDADMAFGIEFVPEVSKAVVDIILAVSGSTKKCLVLDLDNTIWGGTIGDDGIENIQIGDLGQGKAFTELQCWARELERRGIMLAICSKNDEAIAKAVFEQHPDMALSLEHISIFVANWGSKVDNLKRIKSFLNIGYDAMVFLDDNPYERGVVKHHLPDICVPDLPEDSADYLSFLRSLNLFETASFTGDDAYRTSHFRQELKREEIQRSFTDERGFLRSLRMTGEIVTFTPFNVPRVAQLIQKSNQFNLRTVRYTESDLERFAASEGYLGWGISIADSFGNCGLISAVIGQIGGNELFIDTWVMSCRVLKRGVESLVLNALVDFSRQRGLQRILGEFIPTKKNALVKDHYLNLGFQDAGGGRWVLDIATYTVREHFIAEKPRLSERTV
jgi:FkbH-like protein